MDTTSHYRIDSGEVSVRVGISHGTAEILHWGMNVGDVSEEQSGALFDSHVAHNDSDISGPFGLWRENSRGHVGRPTAQLHRMGQDFSPMFELETITQTEDSLQLVSTDRSAGISVTASITSLGFGVMRWEYAVSNLGQLPLIVNDLDVWLPLPDRANESMDFTGRWAKERQPQRRTIEAGLWTREGREGRPGFDHTVVELAMTSGADFQSGEVWSVGLEFSGNPRYGVEKQPTGKKSLMAGSVLLPGEIILEPGETFTAPSVLSSYSANGLDGLSSTFHSWLRSRPGHPTRNGPRPLTLNVWEAVYFDHRLEKLTELAEVAAEVGVERFVLDDGWFGSRRDDTSGLGDWTVSADVWPEGLTPLIEVVNSLGMAFGLWFEGEMVNADSELYRNHPDWILKVGNRVPPEGRNQQVLDFTNEAAFNHVLEAVSDVLTNNNISYIKWDHNRVLTDAAHGGSPSVITQTLAIYRMFDLLRERFPGLEIESCSSGGARIDLGMAQHADRFWASDCNEALERQQIQRWTQMAIPPEMLGTHIGPSQSHQTGRSLSLNFRALTALFGHAGIEWDLTETNSEEREVLQSWAAYYRQHRELLHSGTVTRIDQPDQTVWVHGVVSGDQTQALFAYVALGTIDGSNAARFTLEGLSDSKTYRVSAGFPAGKPDRAHDVLPAWAESGAVLTGRQLRGIGLTAPIIAPESGFVVEVIEA